MKFFGNGNGLSSRDYPPLAPHQYNFDADGKTCVLETTSMALAKKIIAQLQWFNEDRATFPEDRSVSDAKPFSVNTQSEGAKLLMTITGDMAKLSQFFDSYQKLSQPVQHTHGRSQVAEEGQRLILK